MKKHFFLALVFLMSSCKNGTDSGFRLPSMALLPPDEYSVMASDPLYIPPDFTLRAPELQESEKKKSKKNSNMSKSEMNFLDKSSVKASDENIKKRLNYQSSLEQQHLIIADEPHSETVPGSMSKSSTKDAAATAGARSHRKELGIPKSQDVDDLVGRNKICDIEGGIVKTCDEKERTIKKTITFDGEKPKQSKVLNRKTPVEKKMPKQGEGK